MFLKAAHTYWMLCAPQDRHMHRKDGGRVLVTLPGGCDSSPSAGLQSSGPYKVQPRVPSEAKGEARGGGFLLRSLCMHGALKLPLLGLVRSAVE